MPKLTFYTLLILVLVGAFSPFLANDTPIWFRYQGKQYFPALNDYRGVLGSIHWKKVSWSDLPESDRILPLIPFSGSQTTMDVALPPGSKTSLGWHWLGTDKDGRDVLAGLIEGTTGALLVGVLAMLVALLIGGLLGGVAGFYGDAQLRIPVLSIFPISFILLGWVYLLTISRAADAFGSLEKVGLSAAAFGLIGLICWIFRKGKSLPFPIDLLVMRIAEVVETVPKLIFLLVVSQLLEDPSTSTLAILIGIFSWPGTARLLRGELIKIRNAPYVEAAQQLGLSDWVVFTRHALPAALRPIALIFALGAGQAVLLDAALTFLNLGGNSMGRVSWGVLLQSARYSIGLVWVWLSPGLVLVLLSSVLYYWSERLTLNN
jgi:peptide/nickel transport system permease protein